MVGIRWHWVTNDNAMLLGNVIADDYIDAVDSREMLCFTIEKTWLKVR